MFRAKTTAASQPAEQAPAVAVSWTRGHHLATTAARILAWTLVACGPLALIIVLATLTGSPSTPTAPAPAVAEPAGRTLAEGAGELAVVAWLRATRLTPAGTEILPAGDLPDTAWTVSDSTVIDSTYTNDTWTITIATTITTASAGESGTSSRRFFTIPVTVTDQRATITGLPAEIATPITGPSNAADAYRQQLPTTDPVAETAAGFLAALLTGTGDITRYLAPDQTAAITAITPAPYTTVTLTTVAALAPVPTQPTDAQTTELVVTAHATTADNHTITLQYALQLRARSGRWEVSALHGAPLPATTATAESSPTPTKSK